MTTENNTALIAYQTALENTRMKGAGFSLVPFSSGDRGLGNTMVAGQKEDGSKTIVERSEKSAFIAGEDLEPGDVVTLDGEGRVIKYRHGGGIKRYASEEQAKIEADVRLAEQSLAVREICAIMNLSEESVRLAITDCGADLCQMLAQARKIKADREEYDHQKRAEASVWLRALRRRGI